MKYQVGKGWRFWKTDGTYSTEFLLDASARHSPTYLEHDLVEQWRAAAYTQHGGIVLVGLSTILRPDSSLDKLYGVIADKWCRNCFQVANGVASLEYFLEAVGTELLLGGTDSIDLTLALHPSCIDQQCPEFVALLERIDRLGVPCQVYFWAATNEMAFAQMANWAKCLGLPNQEDYNDLCAEVKQGEIHPEFEERRKNGEYQVCIIRSTGEDRSSRAPAEDYTATKRIETISSRSTQGHDHFKVHNYGYKDSRFSVEIEMSTCVQCIRYGHSMERRELNDERIMSHCSIDVDRGSESLSEECD